MLLSCVHIQFILCFVYESIFYEIRKVPTTCEGIDPPGNGQLGGQYFHAGCPSVIKTKTRYNASKCPENKIHAMKNTMHENNDHLLAMGPGGSL